MDRQFETRIARIVRVSTLGRDVYVTLANTLERGPAKLMSASLDKTETAQLIEMLLEAQKEIGQ
jgi:hypothetical protein